MKYVRSKFFVYKIPQKDYDCLIKYLPNTKNISKLTYYIIRPILWIISILLFPIGIISYYLSLLFNQIDKWCSKFISLL